MTASRDFENKSFGKIKKGKIIPERVLKNMDTKSLLDAGFIFDETKISDGIGIDDEVSFSTVKLDKKKDSKK